ncbi:MAG: NAD-dependent epimerase/dehydratase family protein, partial [Chloroflexi bacterium]|nr:NAD-dependent epimerase/dehydratase family protein [Chloroflexota bacterium]
MKILISGGAGFIGSNLCQALLEAGHEVTAVDNLLTGSRRNIKPLLVHPSFHFLEQDIVHSPIHGEWEAIFHLASPASPQHYSKYPIETLLVNSQGTYHLLELARTLGAKFLLASTSEVYGDPLE